MKTIPHRYEEFGIQCWHGTSPPMERVHSHFEIEMNLIERGSLLYTFGSEERAFQEGSLYVFSGIEPHRLAYTEPGTVFSWLTIPASYFTGWQIAGKLTRSILSGDLIYDDDPIEAERDLVRFHRWRQDLERGDPRYIRVVLLEVRARLERLALSMSRSEVNRKNPPTSAWSKPVALMMSCILNNLTDSDLGLKDIAASAGFNASYASTLFSRKVGMTPINFLTEQRLAYAKFLLATSDSKVLDIALASGFGSSSQFYEVFRRATGKSPREMRN